MKSKPPKTNKHDAVSREGKRARMKRYDLFCAEYVKDFNASRAARDAGYSVKTAREIGAKLLTKVVIKQKIQKLADEREARVLMEGDDILLETKKFAKADIRRLYDKEGALLPMDEWPDDIAGAVASVQSYEKRNPLTGEVYGIVKKVKLWEKPKGLEMLAKNKKLLTDKIETDVYHSGTVGVITMTIDEAEKLLDQLDAKYKDTPAKR